MKSETGDYGNGDLFAVAIPLHSADYPSGFQELLVPFDGKDFQFICDAMMGRKRVSITINIPEP